MVFNIDDETQFNHYLNMEIVLVNGNSCVWMMFDVAIIHYLNAI